MNTPRIRAVTAEPSERWRVEDLARRADLSVDTIRFYQKRRLLPAPERAGRLAWYGPEHLERLARIRELRGRGLTLALIGRIARRRPRRHRRAARGRGRPRRRGSAPRSSSRSPSSRNAPACRSRSSKPSRARTSSSRACTTAKRATPPPTSRSCNRDSRLLEQGLPLPDLLALAHEHHETTREIAETAVGLFDRYVRAPLARVRPARRREGGAARRSVPRAAPRGHRRSSRTTSGACLLEVAQEHLESVGEEIELAAVNVAAAEPARELADMSRASATAPASPTSPTSTTSRASSRRCSIGSRRATTR